MATVNVALMKKVFDIAGRQWKSDFHPHCHQQDDFTARWKVSEGVGLAYSGRIGGGKIGRKLIPLTLPDATLVQPILDVPD